MIYFLASKVFRCGSTPGRAALPRLRIRPSGSAPGCAAGLCPAVASKKSVGATPLGRPSAERCRGKARTTGIAPLGFLFDSGRAEPCLTSGGKAAASTLEARL
jgi:hypothetical protein